MNMPFGRFKDKPVRSLPRWYLEWLHKQSWISIPLQREVEDELFVQQRKDAAKGWINAGDEIRK